MSVAVAALQVALLLALGWLGREACRRTRVPALAGLTGFGVVLALVGLRPDGLLPTHGLYLVLLPPLIFEAAIQMSPAGLRRDGWLLFVLAVPGVALSAALVALCLWAGFGWRPEAAFLFGALIAATDPVAVISLFRTLRVSSRLAGLVEAESLLNDASAAILFALALGVAGGAAPNWGAVPLRLAAMLAISLAVGAGLGGAVAAVMRALPRGWSRFGLSLLLAYAVFIGAEEAGGSGVLASLAAGLVVARWGRVGEAERFQRRWDKTAGLANAAIFLVLGGLVAANWQLAIGREGWAAMAVTLLARAALIYPVCAAAALLGEPVPWAARHVLVWGGMRGALALSLALSVPAGLTGRADVLAGTLVAVLFSVFGQGLSLGPMVRLLCRGAAKAE